MAMVYFHADAPADAQPEFALPASVRNQVCRRSKGCCWL